MKRNIIIILHMLSILLALAGFVGLRSYSLDGKGISWINGTSFEESIRFSEMVSNDIAGLRRFAVLKQAFEEEGELDDQKMLISADSANGSIAYTIGDVTTLAKKFGYSLDPNHAITVNPQNDSGNYQIRVNYKAYDPYYFRTIVPGPSQGVTTARDMSIEAIRALAEYYSLKELYGTRQTNFLYSAYFLSDSGDEVAVTNIGEPLSNRESLGKYLFIGNDYSVKTNIEPQPEKLMPEVRDFEYSDVEGNVLEVGVDTMYLYADRYKAASDNYESYIRRAYYWIAALIAGAVFALITLVPIIRDSDVKKNGKSFAMDKLPIEGLILLMAFASVMVYGLFRAGLYSMMETLAAEGTWGFWCTTVKMLIVYAFCLVILCSMYRRAYHGGVFSNSLVHRAVIAMTEDNGENIWLVFLAFLAFIGVNAFCAAVGGWCFTHRAETRYYLHAAIILGLIAAALDVAVYLYLYRVGKQRYNINRELKRISEGEIDRVIDESDYNGSELDAVRSINSISDGLSHAINEQVKADRLKADLITNVSHDIKTPLTSIINYVDLIKRENIDNEKIREYVDVLDRKSARLKNLTEDLVEASKASSGNIKMEMSRLDMAQLATQAGGEFEDKFAKRNLEFILEVPGEPAYIWADGRHLWRVFENLLNNAAKYSMEHTRIYAEVRKENGECIYSIKNISQDKLNISPDELTERFIRGDVSRSTEGSGLGLSIAKSLTTLMGGRLVIEIDGDLYKANVILPEYVGPEKEVEEKAGTLELE